tara:strand:+ start:476 stop:790 length:315 start_codon:yes stop_codon:yes gene_type:complete
MGTRSAIGYRLPNRQIRAVYCHYDGYPQHQLPILESSYNSLQAVKLLIAPGYLRCLGETPEYLGDNDQAEVVNNALMHWRNNDCEHLYVFDENKDAWEHYDLRD